MPDDIYDALWELEWTQIPGAEYIMKYKFCDDNYTVLVTNLSEIYGEKLDELDIQERFSLVNPYAEMKPKIIISKVKQALEKNLNGEDSEIKMQCFSQNLTLRLQFSVSQVSFIFDLHPQMLSAENLRAHVVAPTVIASLLTYQENLELKKKIEDLEKKISTSTHKPKPDQKMKSVLSTLSKKSKINAADILESYLHSQKSVTKFISESKCHNDNANNIAESSECNAIQQPEIVLPQKREIDSEGAVATVIKYEDDKGSSSIKEDESDIQSCAPHQTHLKVKKKKTFMF